jgi:hypothetical protein
MRRCAWRAADEMVIVPRFGLSSGRRHHLSTLVEPACLTFLERFSYAANQRLRSHFQRPDIHSESDNYHPPRRRTLLPIHYLDCHELRLLELSFSTLLWRVGRNTVHFHQTTLCFQHNAWFPPTMDSTHSSAVLARPDGHRHDASQARATTTTTPSLHQRHRCDHLSVEGQIQAQLLRTKGL